VTAVSAGGLGEMFLERWARLRGHVFRAGSLEDLPAAIQEAAHTLAGTTGPGSVLAWEPDGIPIDWAALFQPPAWTYHGVRVEGGQLRSVAGPMNRAAFISLAAEARLGLTGAAWAAADTGTVAVYSTGRGAGGSLLPTLLPPAHLVVLRAQQVLPSVADGLRQLHALTLQQGGLPPMVKLISGPSSTADIEGQLWVGVHGPARVGVVLLSE
jgi:L-lactate dehydrogenase complex protein LldG